MSRQEKLISVYKDVLRSVNVIEVDDKLSLNINGSIEPLTCEDKILVLPTHAILKNLNSETHMAFHPLCESAVRGESPVIRLLRSLVNRQLTFTLLQLVSSFLAIAMDNQRQANLSPKQKEFLKLVPEINSDCFDQFKTVIGVIKPDAREKCANIYIKRAPTIRGSSYKRGGIVTFPLLDELRSKGDKVYSKTIKVSNKKVLAAIMGFILGDDGESNSASALMTYGSNSVMAPNFDALMHAYHNVMTRLQNVLSDYKEHITTAAMLESDLSWISSMNDLSVFAGIIPTLNGNEGVVVNTVADGETPADLLVKLPPPDLPKSLAATLNTPQPVTPAVSSTTVTETPVQQQRTSLAAPLSQANRCLPDNNPNSSGVGSWTGFVAQQSQPPSLGLPVTNSRLPMPNNVQVQSRLGNPAFGSRLSASREQAFAVPTVEIPLSNGRTATFGTSHQQQQPQQPVRSSLTSRFGI